VSHLTTDNFVCWRFDCPENDASYHVTSERNWCYDMGKLLARRRHGRVDESRSVVISGLRLCIASNWRYNRFAGSYQAACAASWQCFKSSTPFHSLQTHLWINTINLPCRLVINNTLVCAWGKQEERAKIVYIAGEAPIQVNPTR